MKRPLAVFGGVFLLATLAALQLPWPVLAGAAIGLAVAFVPCYILLRRKWGGVLPLVLAAVLLAFAWRAGYDAVRLWPVQRLAGQTHTVTARVLDVRPGYGDDTVHATLQVTAVEDLPGLGSFRVQVYGLPEVRVGEMLRLDLRLGEYATSQARLRALQNGYALAASAKTAPVRLGTSHSFLSRVRQLQYGASANIRQRLPHRLGGVMAAMAVGDRRFVDSDTTEAYRAAGISHLLVVSGLHLSILCSALAGLAAKGGPRRRWAAGVLGILFVLLFMAFTGLAPSVVRSGVAWLLVFAASLFRRRPDIYTSLGLAALLLVLQNPYAAADVGLLLSFSATLGALAGGAAGARLKRRWAVRRRGWAVRAAFWVFQAALASLVVTLATLPVLVGAGLGLSLFTLPANLLAVPLLPVILASGFVMVIPASWPVLGLLGLPATLVGGGLLSLLEKLTGFCAARPGAWVPLGGGFGLAVVAVFYLLAFLAFKSRRVVAYALVGALLLPLVVLLHTGLSSGTVRVVVAGSGTTSAVVVVRGRQAVVLYRGRQAARQVTGILRQNRVEECLLLVDMRRGTISAEYEELYRPQQVVVAMEDILSRAVYHPFEDVEISLARQGDGMVACVDVGGYRLGLYTGSVNLEPYAVLDVLLAGSGRARGEYRALLVSGQWPDWADPRAQILENQGEALLWIRPGKSVRFVEVGLGDSG